MTHRQEPIFSSLDGLGIEPLVGRKKPSPSNQSGYPPPTEDQQVQPALESGALPASGAPGLEGGEQAPADKDYVAPSFGGMRLSVDSLDFGQVLVKNHEERVLPIHNDGDREFIIESLNGLPSEGFSLVEPPVFPLTVPPHGSLDLKVRFAPDLAGRRTASFAIVPQEADSAAKEFRLAGTAVEMIRAAAGEYYSPIFNSLGMSFIYIPPGSFSMGSPEHERGRNDDELLHEVTLTKSFYLQDAPVTQGQWKALMGNNPAAFIRLGDNCPVEQVSWFDCQEFIKALNALGEGTYRLPTEAEWEYACRAGNTAGFALGEITSLFCDHDPILDKLGWYCGNAVKATHPVAQKSPNTWGIFDMHGNVCEWCQDWYGEYFATPEVDPVGPKSGLKRVVRGGSWFSSAKTCRAASRFSWSPEFGSSSIGLRLVREI
jgi:formylglycine-generating enzyme required for sulfatase activity